MARVPTPRLRSEGTLLLVGMHARMSLAEDDTPALFRAFVPRRHEIAGICDDATYCIRQSAGDGALPVDPHAPFVKWAAFAVREIAPCPEGMALIEIPAGRWAVFEHDGPASAYGGTLGAILEHWLPASGEACDDRPSFDRMPPGYDPAAADAHEEIWLPLR